MSASVIGNFKASNGKTYEVKWDSSNKDTYVSYAGWREVGKASSESEAIAISKNWISSNA